MSKRVNTLLVNELRTFFQGAGPCILVHSGTATAENAVQMRALLREKKIQLHMIRNTLARIALKEIGLGAMGDLIEGPTVVASGGEGDLALAKAVSECTRGKGKGDIQGGYCEGQVLTASQVQEFARIPSREAVLAQVLGGINAPLASLAGMLATIQRSLVTALKAIADQKAKAAEAQPAANA